jgi:hypothetical protein
MHCNSPFLTIILAHVDVSIPSRTAKSASVGQLPYDAWLSHNILQTMPGQKLEYTAEWPEPHKPPEIQLQLSIQLCLHNAELDPLSKLPADAKSNALTMHQSHKQAGHESFLKNEI